MTEPYKTLSAAFGPVVLKERKSKFLGFAFPARNRGQVKEQLESLRDRYPDATHICYAFRIGLHNPETRMNDDGEPAYSAGAPIFGQLEAFGLHNVLVCVVRYYGGKKLGVGGLIQAYREAARQCLLQAPAVVREPGRVLQLDFGYGALDAVMRTISQMQLSIDYQKLELPCQMGVKVPEARAKAVLEAFGALMGVTASWKKADDF